MSGVVLGFAALLTAFIGTLAAVRLFNISSSQLLPGAPGPSQRAPGLGLPTGIGHEVWIGQMNIDLTQPEIERIRMLCQVPATPKWEKIDAAIFDKMELHLQKLRQLQPHLLKLRQAAFDPTEALKQHGEH